MLHDTMEPDSKAIDLRVAPWACPCGTAVFTGLTSSGKNLVFNALSSPDGPFSIIAWKINGFHGNVLMDEYDGDPNDNRFEQHVCEAL